jgi:DNA polymerase III alpha subunit
MNRLYIMHEDEMMAYFRPLGMEHAVEQAGSIGRCVDVTMHLGKPKLPKFPLPLGVNETDHFRATCERGLERRLRENPYMRERADEYLARLMHEMSVIVRALDTQKTATQYMDGATAPDVDRARDEMMTACGVKR